MNHDQSRVSLTFFLYFVCSLRFYIFYRYFFVFQKYIWMWRNKNKKNMKRINQTNVIRFNFLIFLVIYRFIRNWICVTCVLYLLRFYVWLINGTKVDWSLFSFVLEEKASLTHICIKYTLTIISHANLHCDHKNYTRNIQKLEMRKNIKYEKINTSRKISKCRGTYER